MMNEIAAAKIKKRKKSENISVREFFHPGNFFKRKTVLVTQGKEYLPG